MFFFLVVQEIPRYRRYLGHSGEAIAIPRRLSDGPIYNCFSGPDFVRIRHGEILIMLHTRLTMPRNRSFELVSRYDLLDVKENRGRSYCTRIFSPAAMEEGFGGASRT